MNQTVRPLLWRLGVPVALLQVVLFICLGVWMWSHIKQSHIQIAHDELAEITQLWSPRYSAMLQADATAELTQSVATDSQRINRRITVIGPDGRIIADSEVPLEDAHNMQSRAEISAAMTNGIGGNQQTATDRHTPIVYVARRLDGASGPLGVLRLRQSVTAHRDQFASVRNALIFACGMIVFLTIGLIFLADRRLAAQSNALAADAERFADRDFAKRNTFQSSGPLASLSLALDRMADQLETRFEEIQLQQQQQRAILQSMSNAVLAVDTEQRIVTVNRAAEELLGLHSATVQGRLLQEVIRQPELHGFVKQALSDSAPHQMEMRLMGETPITVQAASGPLTTVDGDLAGVLLVLNDVTELRRLEALRSDFAANVSHELRTPITNLKGYIETLLEVGTSDYPQTQKFLKVIKQNIDRLSAIVDDVMALTELERPRGAVKGRGRERLERVSSSIPTIVTNVIEQFRPRAGAKRITLKSRVASDLRAKVQPRLIEQAIGNLVSNAIAYSPPDTTVVIEAHSIGDELEIAVTDQGPGIEEEHLPRLWERFYRVDQARSREAGGTGLGLAIVKHIALSHGGSVDVTSEIGRGSRFVINLPLA